MIPYMAIDRFIRNRNYPKVGPESIHHSKWRRFPVMAILVEAGVWRAGVKGVGAGAGNIPHGKYIDILQGDDRQGRG